MPGTEGPRGDDAIVALDLIKPEKGEKGLPGLQGRDGPKGNQGLRGKESYKFILIYIKILEYFLRFIWHSWT